MAIIKFTMEDVDAEILQIVQQQDGGQQSSAGPRNIVRTLLDKAKAKRNGNNGTSQT